MDRTARRWFLIRYGIWLFGAIAYFIPSSTWSPVSRLNLTRAIVEQGTISVDAFAESTGDRAKRAGHWYCDKAPFPSLLAVPAYAVFHTYSRLRGKKPEFVAFHAPDTPAQRLDVNRTFQNAVYVCSLSTAGAAGTALGLLLFLVLVRSMGPAIAFWASAIAVLATPVFAYATSFYGHVPATALLFGGVAAVSADWTSEAQSEESLIARPKRLRIAGACLAAAIGCEYLMAVPAGIIALYILWRGSARPVFTCWQLALGALLPFALLAGYHWLAFGLPWKTAYSFIERPEFARGHASGFLGITVPSSRAIWGLTFGTERGLFFIAPVTLLGLALALSARLSPGTAVSARAGFKPDVRHAFALAALALFLVNASYYMWWGGAAFGPRHLLPVVPLAAYGIARACSARGARVATFLLAAVSFANVLSGTMVGLEAPERGNVLSEFAWRHLEVGQVAAISGSSNLGLQLGLPALSTFGPLLAWLLIGCYGVVRGLPKNPPELTTATGSGLGRSRP
ncbi:MAG TPA: hypothetical protein VI072_30825 [Polyangiaceae bacterium]